MREASSRPKREYKPKPREPLDLGEPEQSNGGFPCATAPKITGNGGEGTTLPQAPSGEPPARHPSNRRATSLHEEPQGWAPGPTPAFSAYLCSLFARSFVIFPILRQAHPDPQQQEHA